MKVLVWATTFGADLWSYVRHLDARDDVQLRIVMPGPDRFAAQHVARLYPIAASMTKRRPFHHLTGLLGFRPDVTIMDNWIPKRRTSPTGFMLWHGFGWGAGTDREGFAAMHRNIARAWGDAQVPNSSFRWQCFGPSDFAYRTERSGFHPDNCRLLGAASHDDLRQPIDRALVRDAYACDVVGRKTVLIAPTWAYGEMLAHWGDDSALFERLLKHIDALGANAVIRMHDTFRYSDEHRAKLAALSRQHPGVMFKYKDEAPDNFIDLQVADVLVTNFSSIANLFYATRRPTVHVNPALGPDSELIWRTREGGELVEHRGTTRELWKMPPEDNGGLLAGSFEELLAQVELALADPTCCEAQAQAFLDAHMMGADGGNCARIDAALAELCG